MKLVICEKPSVGGGGGAPPGGRGEKKGYINGDRVFFYLCLGAFV